jgi:CDP-glucose 4,6-dehydratase
MTTLRQWFAGKRVLLTGHTGFKGAWLSAWLLDAGADVTGLSLPQNDRVPSLFRDAGLIRDVHSYSGDIRDARVVQGVLSESRAEIVLHLAAQSLVRRSYNDPVGTFDTNVMGLVNVCEAVRQRSDVHALVVVTSDKCYENREAVHRYREDDPMGGYDPYSASKGCAELVTAAYRRSFLAASGTQVATARAGNVIGGGDWSDDRLVPDLMRAAARNKAVSIRNPDAVRPWQHVLEPLRGYLQLARALTDGHHGACAEGWNFGPVEADAVPVRDVVAMLQQHWPSVRMVHERDANTPHEAGLLALDASKAAARLDWTPVLGLPQALEWTARWYREFFDGERAASALVADELARYAALVDRQAAHASERDSIQVQP